MRNVGLASGFGACDGGDRNVADGVPIRRWFNGIPTRPARRINQFRFARSKVEKKNLEETIGGTAVTMPALIATITIPMSSSEVLDRQVKTINDWPGSVVKKGKTIIEFEPALYSQVVRERQAIVSQTTQATRDDSETVRPEGCFGPAS